MSQYCNNVIKYSTYVWVAVGYGRVLERRLLAVWITHLRIIQTTWQELQKLAILSRWTYLGWEWTENPIFTISRAQGPNHCCNLPQVVVLLPGDHEGGQVGGVDGEEHHREQRPDARHEPGQGGNMTWRNRDVTWFDMRQATWRWGRGGSPPARSPGRGRPRRASRCGTARTCGRGGCWTGRPPPEPAVDKY